MKFISIILASFLVTGTAHAQLGNLLNELKKNINQPSSSNQSQENPSTKSQPNTTRDKVLSGYCDRVSNADFTNKIGEIYLKSVQAGNAVVPRYAIDDLKPWVFEKFRSELNIETGTKYEPETHVSVIYDTINECLKKSQDKKFINAFVIWNIQKDSDSFLIPSEGRSKSVIDQSMNSRQTLLFAYLFDGADEKIQTTFPKLVQIYESEVHQQERYQKDAQEQKAREKANAAIEAKRKQELDKQSAIEAAFLATSDGQLTSTYQAFQVIQTCYEIRKEFAVKFVSENEYSDFRSRMKSIESKLKNSLTEKNTDKLWAMAERRNRKYDASAGYGVVYLDLIERIKTKSKTNWTAAKEDCDSMIMVFRTQSNELLGKESLKKNF
jgi:hypothetical protein